MTQGRPAGCRRRRAVVLAAAALTSVAACAEPSSWSDPAARTLPAAGALPAPVEGALPEPRPRPLPKGKHLSRWAPVRRAVTARSRPRPNASVVAPVPSRTPEGTQNVVGVLGHRVRAGRVWVHVRLAELPNGTTGWVPRPALGGYGTVRTVLVVSLGDLRATLYRGGRRLLQAPVGVGRPEWPTPTGEFYIRNKLTGFASGAYGPVAFGTSARSAVLTDWPAGGFIGIHGTDQPELLPGRVSHGCIRLRNRDILRLAALMPVGTPVRITS
jgi:hypothetical protein